jgi:predicted FMN-binding regulatory protein PaiB
MSDVPRPIFGEIRGRQGQITIPSLGAVPGIMSSWHLKRRETPGPDVGPWDFHAVLSYGNQAYFDDADLAPMMVFTVSIGNRADGSPNVHRLEGPFERTVLKGLSLEILGAALCLNEEEAE